MCPWTVWCRNFSAWQVPWKQQKIASETKSSARDVLRGGNCAEKAAFACVIDIQISTCVAVLRTVPDAG